MPRAAAVSASRAQRHDEAIAAVLHEPLLRLSPNASDDKGVQLLATVNMPEGTPVLVETPLLATPRASTALRHQIESFTRRLRATNASPLAALLAERWLLVVREFATAPADTRDAVLGLQTEFSIPNGPMPKAVAELAKAVHVSGLFSAVGTNTLTEDMVKQVLSSMVINAADTMPDGSEALFYWGALMEHSCAPNTRFLVYQAEDAPPGRGVEGVLAPESWVGEWRTTTAVAEEEPLSFSYLTPEWLARNVTERRNFLCTKMGFLCRCQRCEDEASAAELAADCRRRRQQQQQQASKSDAGTMSTVAASSVCHVSCYRLSELD